MDSVVDEGSDRRPCWTVSLNFEAAAQWTVSSLGALYKCITFEQVHTNLGM